MPTPRDRRLRVVVVGLLALALSGCTSQPGDLGRDAEGRPIDPGPPASTRCVTPPSGASCVPVHVPPTRVYVEQAIPELLPTRGYGSIGSVRCTGRTPGPTTREDPSGLYAESHWTCAGREPEGTWLHEDVAWTPAVGLLGHEAVTRDRSSALVRPLPDDPGLPNPHASEDPTPSA